MGKIKKTLKDKQEIKKWLLDNKRLFMYLNIQKEAITFKTELYSLNIDSLDLLEIIIDFEDEFNIKIEEEKLSKLNTVGDFIELLYNKIKGDKV